MYVLLCGRDEPAPAVGGHVYTALCSVTYKFARLVIQSIHTVVALHVEARIHYHLPNPVKAMRTKRPTATVIPIPSTTSRTKLTIVGHLSDHPVCFYHTTLEAYIDALHRVNIEGRIFCTNYLPALTTPEVLRACIDHWSGHLNPHPHVLPLWHLHSQCPLDTQYSSPQPS